MFCNLNIPKSSRFRLIFTGMTVNMFYLAFGCVLSYPSPAVPNINGNRNPFRVDGNEQSWIGSIIFIGLAIGGLVCGSVADALGRKLAMMCCGFMCVVGLTIVASAVSVQMMLAGMLIMGVFGSTTTVSVLLYTSEIAPDDSRGLFVSLCLTTQMVGTVTVYAAGVFLTWNWLAIFIAALYAIPSFVVVFLPESPRWFLLKGNREAAAHGLRWFRGEEVDIDAEMEVIEQSLVVAPKGMSAWRDLVEKKNLTSIFICCVLFFIQLFSGYFVLSIFTVSIFQAANANMNPNVESVITGLFSCFGGIACLFLVERCGRRRLLLVSTVGVALSVGLVATFFQIQELNPVFAAKHLFWLPVLAVSLCNFMFCLALFPTPWVFSCEFFSTNVRGIAQNVLTFVSCSLGFAATKTFTNIKAAIHTSRAFWLYTAVNVFGVFFIIFAVKERKHKIMT